MCSPRGQAADIRAYCRVDMVTDSSPSLAFAGLTVIGDQVKDADHVLLDRPRHGKARHHLTGRELVHHIAPLVVL